MRFIRNVGSSVERTPINLISLNRDSMVLMAELKNIPYTCMYRPSNTIMFEMQGSLILERFPNHPNVDGSKVYQFLETHQPGGSLDRWVADNAGSGWLPVKTQIKVNDDVYRAFFFTTMKEGRLRDCYLLILANQKFYRIPYTNQFDNGRLCMGADYETDLPSRMSNLGALFNFALSSFMSATNNHDLADSRAGILHSYCPELDLVYSSLRPQSLVADSFTCEPSFVLDLLPYLQV